MAEVIEKRSGVCQDFTHVMLGMCRSLKIPARYVSGYLYNGPTDELEGSQASHAWCEVFVPGLRLAGARPHERPAGRRALHKSGRGPGLLGHRARAGHLPRRGREGDDGGGKGHAGVGDSRSEPAATKLPGICRGPAGWHRPRCDSLSRSDEARPGTILCRVCRPDLGTCRRNRGK